MLSSGFLGVSLVFMLLYVWSREFPNAQINIYGLVTLKVGVPTPAVFYFPRVYHQSFYWSSHISGLSWFAYLQAFYLPWVMLAMDVIFGSKLVPDLMGIIAGHIYYFLTVLYPVSSGRNILKTPIWVYPFCRFNFFTCHQITYILSHTILRFFKTLENLWKPLHALLLFVVQRFRLLYRDSGFWTDKDY